MGILSRKLKELHKGESLVRYWRTCFLHYAFDQWLTKHHPDVQFARYADDIVCHCRTEQEAITLLAVLKERFVSCGLLLHPEKTKIVYCKSWKNKADYAQISFDFLGFTFRPRLTKCRDGILLVCFLPAVSRKAAQRIRDEINSWPWLKWTQCGVKSIIVYSRSKLRGWMTYYGKYGRSVISQVLFHFDKKLSRWAKRKYKKIKSITQAVKRVNAFKSRNPRLLAHW
jgi:hypothetical protein